MVTKHVGKYRQSATMLYSLINIISVTYSVIIDMLFVRFHWFVTECQGQRFVVKNKVTFLPSICGLKCETAWYAAKSSLSKMEYFLWFSDSFFYSKIELELDHHLLSNAVLYPPHCWRDL